MRVRRHVTRHDHVRAHPASQACRAGSLSQIMKLVIATPPSSSSPSSRPGLRPPRQAAATSPSAPGRRSRRPGQPRRQARRRRSGWSVVGTDKQRVGPLKRDLDGDGSRSSSRRLATTPSRRPPSTWCAPSSRPPWKDFDGRASPWVARRWPADGSRGKCRSWAKPPTIPSPRRSSRRLGCGPGAAVVAGNIPQRRQSTAPPAAAADVYFSSSYAASASASAASLKPLAENERITPPASTTTT